MWIGIETAVLTPSGRMLPGNAKLYLLVWTIMILWAVLYKIRYLHWGISMLLGPGSRIALPASCKLYQCPASGSNLFLSISPSMICLWRANQTYLLSYIQRGEASGNYLGLHAWDREDWRKIWVRVGEDQVDCYELHQCPAQLPVKFGQTGWFLVYLRSEVVKDVVVDSFIKYEATDEHVILKEYYHTIMSEWIKFGCDLKLSKGSLYDFCPALQMLATFKEGTLSVGPVRLKLLSSPTWTVEFSTALLKICWYREMLFCLANGSILVYSSIGELLYKRAVGSCTDFLVLEDNSVISTTEGLEIYSLYMPCSSVNAAGQRLDVATTNQCLVFREALFADHQLRWETVDFPHSKALTNADWICYYTEGSFAWKRHDASEWKHSRIIGMQVEEAMFLSSGLLLLTGSTPSNKHMLRIVDPASETVPTLYQLELDRKWIWCGVASKSSHFIAIFSDLSVHFYRIVEGGRGVIFDLNLSLSGLNMFDADLEKGSTPPSSWKVDLFSQQSMASPSEVDLTGSNLFVNIDCIVFQQVGALFAVNLRPSAVGEAVSAAWLDPSGVGNFFLYQLGGDFWLIVTRAGGVDLRRWPFVAETDAHIKLDFAVDSFYPEINGGLLCGLESLASVQTCLLAPSLLLFYLQEEDEDSVKLILARVDDASMMIEYVLLEIIQLDDREEAGLALKYLDEISSCLLPRVGYIRALIRLGRKAEVSDAAWLFTHTSSVKALFDECMSAGELDLATQILMLRLVAEDSAVDRIPVLKLVEAALAAEHFKVVAAVRGLVQNIWPDSDINLVNETIVLAAGQLVREYRWCAFLALGKAIGTSGETLFEDCFGKMTEGEFERVRCSLPLEQKVAAIYAQLDMCLQNIGKDISAPSTPIVNGTQPSQVNMSSTELTVRPSSYSESVIRFLESIDCLREDAALWRVAHYAEEADINRLSQALRNSLRDLYQGYSETAWIACKL